jgi:hypothetical protein
MHLKIRVRSSSHVPLGEHCQFPRFDSHCKQRRRNSCPCATRDRGPDSRVMDVTRCKERMVVDIAPCATMRYASCMLLPRWKRPWDRYALLTMVLLQQMTEQACGPGISLCRSNPRGLDIPKTSWPQEPAGDEHQDSTCDDLSLGDGLFRIMISHVETH